MQIDPQGPPSGPTQISGQTPIRASQPPIATPPNASEDVRVFLPEESVQVTALDGPTEAPVVPLESEEDPAQILADGKARFHNAFGSTKGYLRPGDPKLAQSLAKYNLSENMKAEIGRNPRGLDFLHVLEKARKGEQLSRDDVEKVQVFVVQDTRMGGELAYTRRNGQQEEGVDGFYGPRTHHALERFFENYSADNLVATPYYDQLDQKGVEYARYVLPGETH